MSLRSIRAVLTYSYVDEIFSEGQFVLLYDHYKLKNPDFSHEHKSRFDFDDLKEAEFQAHFRVEKRHLHDLASAIQIPPSFQTYQRSVVEVVEGFCMLLKRFA